MAESSAAIHARKGPDSRSMLKRIFGIALPMVASNASETVMLFADRLFLSRVSKLHFASAMTGGLASFTFSSLFAGITGYVNAIVAQYYGASREDNCARATVQSIYLSFMALPVLIVLAIFIPRLFEIMGHDPLQVPLEATYARWLLSSSVLLLLRNGLTGFFVGTGRTRVVMIANVSAMLVNVPLNYLFIFGKLGMPELGIVGAAIGTIGGSFTAFAILLCVYLSPQMNRRYGTRSNWQFDREMFRRLVRYGTPAGIESFLNVFAFNLFVQLMHSYGADVAAATTIAFNWDVVAFIPMLGLGSATTSITGQYIGAGDPHGARRAALMALRLAFVYSGCMAILFFTGARPLVALFSSGFTDLGSVSSLARQMLRLAGLYTVADSAQLIFAGALRGAGDTQWVMRMSVILHWVMASAAVILIRVVQTPPLVVWCFFIGFVISLGISMFLRFRGGKWMSMRVI